MKKSSSSELRSKGGGGSVPNISKPTSDKVTRRQLDSNNNNNTLPRSVKLNPAKEKSKSIPFFRGIKISLKPFEEIAEVHA